MYLRCSVIAILFGFAISLTIVVPKCNPPDLPEGGSYGPVQEYYVVGDIVYYYCDSDSFISGNFYRRCEDDGDWTGDTPVCDLPIEFSIANQTSTSEPIENNEAFLANDNDQSTCSSTTSGRGNYWMGLFKEPAEVIRVMIFMPQGDTSCDVLLLKSNGTELSCGREKDRYSPIEWKIHNCPNSISENTIGIKIKSSSSSPLQICEIRAFLLTSPTCVDPHLRIENGKLRLTRKTASLICDRDFVPGPEEQIECVRENAWNKKTLYCQKQLYDLSEKNNPPESEA